MRGGAFFAVLLALPFFGLAHWQLNLLIFVLMFATMSSAWNLVGGFAGYPSLGHAAFFGIGAYAIGLDLQGRTPCHRVRAVLRAAGRRADRRARSAGPSR